jgi:outer membrane immunogenic protein
LRGCRCPRRFAGSPQFECSARNTERNSNEPRRSALAARRVAGIYASDIESDDVGPLVRFRRHAATQAESQETGLLQYRIFSRAISSEPDAVSHCDLDFSIDRHRCEISTKQECRAGFRVSQVKNHSCALRPVAMLLALVAAGELAHAADLPTSAAPAPPAARVAPSRPAAIDWTGFYAGAHGGLGYDHYGFKYFVDLPGAAFTGTNGIDAFGPLLGLQVGFNYQIPSSVLPLVDHLPGGLVVGVEIDNSWSGVYGDTTGSGVPPTTQGTVTFGGRLVNVGTARLRIGYAIDRFLFYVTGGFLYGVNKNWYSLRTSTGFQAAGVSTDVRSGAPLYVGALGIGVEYAITSNWTVRAEYFYDGINAHYERFNPATGSIVGYGTRAMFHSGRLGVNFKLDWGPPATVAR